MLTTLAQEAARADALDAITGGAAGPRPELGTLAAQAAALFDCASAAVTLIDRDTLWVAAGVGMDAPRYCRSHALCDIAIRGAGPMVIPDTLAVPVLAGHPAVVGAPYVRFYASVPLATAAGHRIGTICAFDDMPRTGARPEAVAGLAALARQAIALLEPAGARVAA